MIYVSDERQGAVVSLPDLSGRDWATSGLPPAPAPRSAPSDVCLHPDGRLVVADRSRGVVIAMDRDGANPVTMDPAGSPVGPLLSPSAVAVGLDGAVYVADTGNHRVVRASSVEAPTWTSYGTAGVATPGGFLTPSAVDVDATGRLLVADPAANRLVRFDDMAGLNWTEVTLPMNSARPYGVCADGDGVLVTELTTRSVLRLHADDSVSVILSDPALLAAPIAAVRDDSTIVVADAGLAQLTRWKPDGDSWTCIERLAGIPRALPGPEFTRLSGLAVS